MDMIKSCALCRREFTAHRADALYCCKACKQAAVRVRKAIRMNRTTYADVRIVPRGGDVR